MPCVIIQFSHLYTQLCEMQGDRKWHGKIHWWTPQHLYAKSIVGIQSVDMMDMEGGMACLHIHRKKLVEA